MIDGFGYVLRQPLILGLLSLMAVTGLFGTPYINLMPVFARDVLVVGERGLGFLMAAVGVGAMLGALGVANMRHGHRGRWLVTGSMIFPIMLIAFAALPQFGPALIVLVLAGTAFIMQQSLVNTLLQLIVDDRMRGRIMSLYGLLFIGVQQAGNLVAGGAAQLWGAPITVAAGAMICMVFAAGLFVRSPTIRRLE